MVEYDDRIIGYFTLVTDTINPKQVDGSVSTKYEYAKLPAVKIARLATDQKYLRLGVLIWMMIWTFRIVLNMIGDVGCLVITGMQKAMPRNFIGTFLFTLYPQD